MKYLKSLKAQLLNSLYTFFIKTSKILMRLNLLLYKRRLASICFDFVPFIYDILILQLRATKLHI